MDRVLDLVSDHGEDVTNQLSKERFILHDELGHIHLSQS
jgi:hypothetical protein